MQGSFIINPANLIYINIPCVKELVNNVPLLHWAIERGFHVKDILKAQDVDINQVNPVNGETPLHTAVRTNNLVAMGACFNVKTINPNLVNRNGHTSLHIALEKNIYSCIILVANGAKMSCLNPEQINIHFSRLVYQIKISDTVDLSTIGKGILYITQANANPIKYAVIAPDGEKREGSIERSELPKLQNENILSLDEVLQITSNRGHTFNWMKYRKAAYDIMNSTTLAIPEKKERLLHLFEKSIYCEAIQIARGLARKLSKVDENKDVYLNFFKQASFDIQCLIVEGILFSHPYLASFFTPEIRHEDRCQVIRKRTRDAFFNALPGQYQLTLMSPTKTLAKENKLYVNCSNNGKYLLFRAIGPNGTLSTRTMPTSELPLEGAPTKMNLTPYKDMILNDLVPSTLKGKRDPEAIQPFSPRQFKGN